MTNTTATTPGRRIPEEVGHLQGDRSAHFFFPSDGDIAD